MATLSQYINLSDGVTGPLKRMSDMANAAVGRMERLGRAATVSETQLARMSQPVAAINQVATAVTASTIEITNGASNVDRAVTNMAHNVSTATAAAKAEMSSVRITPVSATQSAPTIKPVTVPEPAVNTGVFSRIAAGAESAAAHIQRIAPASASAESALTGLGEKALGVFGSIKASIAGILSMMAGMFAIGSVVSIIQQAREAAAGQAQAELKLDVIMRQRMGANTDMVNSIKQLIASQEELGVVSRQVQTAGAQQLATFVTQRDSLATLIPAMNNLAVQQHGTKATAEDMVNISNMMGRALQGNVGALTRCGISFNATQEHILKFGNEAERAAVMAEVITQNVGNMNEKFGETPAGNAVQKMNEITRVLERVGKGVSGAFNQLRVAGGDIQIGGIETLGWALTNVINAFAFFAQAATEAYAAAKPFAQNIGQAFQDNWSLIEPILIAVIAALAVYEVSMLSGVIASIAAAGASIAHAVASAAETAAIIALTIAQEGLTAAMAMCPWTWVAFAIIAIVAVFYLAVAAVNKFAGTSVSATGLIFYAFAWLGSMIANIFVFAANNAIRVANFIITAFVAVANFLGSIWYGSLSGSLTAVSNLFKDIWNGIADMVSQAINNIIDMINMIPGIDKVLGHVDHVDPGSIHATPQAVDGYQRIDASDYKIDEITPVDAKANASKAYDFGASISDRIGKIFKPQTPQDDDKKDDQAGQGLPESMGGPADNGKKIADHTGKIADNTQRIADKIDMTDEEIKELRAMALQSTMNSWQDSHNIEIHIDQKNTVNGDTDIDGMTSDLVSGLREALATHGERTVLT